jgi:hypothetical protein
MEDFLLKDCVQTKDGNSTGGNASLWGNITKRKGQFSLSLSEAPLLDLLTNIGPDGSGKRWTEPEETWEDRVGSLVAAITNKTYVPPPLIATNFWEDEQHLADGNHRHEALVRCGYDKYWCIILKIDKPEKAAGEPCSQ